MKWMIWQRPQMGWCLVAGQSNARKYIEQGLDFGQVTYAGNFARFAYLDDPTRMNAKSLAVDWQANSGLDLYEDLVAIGLTLPKGRKNTLTWIQGEADANNESQANAYLANLKQFVIDYHNDTQLKASELGWLLIQLHVNNGNPYASTVRAAPAAFVADPPTVYGGSPAVARVVDVDGTVSLDPDNVHWENSTIPAAGNLIRDEANTLYGFTQKYTGR